MLGQVSAEGLGFGLLSNALLFAPCRGLTPRSRERNRTGTSRPTCSEELLLRLESASEDKEFSFVPDLEIVNRRVIGGSTHPPDHSGAGRPRGAAFVSTRGCRMVAHGRGASFSQTDIIYLLEVLKSVSSSRHG